MMILIIPLIMETMLFIYVQESHIMTKINICIYSLPNNLLYYCDLRCLSNFLNCLMTNTENNNKTEKKDISIILVYLSLSS